MKTILKLSAFSLFIIILWSSCNLFNTVSPTERLEQFTASLNSDSRTTTYTHIHSGNPVYNQIKASTWWDGSSLSTTNNPFAFSVTLTGDSGGIQTYSGTMSHNAASFAVIITFKEVVSGDDTWFINSLSLDGTEFFQ